MSNFVAATAALRTALETGFTALPLYWPNGSSDPTLADAPNGFVFSRVRLLDEGAVSIGPNGARTHRDRGEFAVYVYVPAGTLSGAAEAHAEAIRALFGVTSVADVIVTRRTIAEGRDVDGPYGRLWCVPVLVEWFSDRTE